MSKRLFIFTLFFVFASLAFSQSKIFLDVKTPFAEKNKLVAAKGGAVYFLKQSRDLGVREIGENYSLWLKNYKSEQRGQQVYIEFDVELRSPAMIRKGRLLASDRVHVQYKLDDKLDGKAFESFEHFKKHIKKLSHELLLEGYYCGQEVLRVTRSLIREVR